MIGDILSELRRDHNVDQKLIAELLMVSPGTVSNYETGKHKPSLDSISALADFYGVTTDFLFGRTDSRLSRQDLDAIYSSDITVEQILDKLLKLSPSNRNTLINVLNALLLTEIINKR
jgi:transcriptional regulator with XRE-family HTH domain